MTKNLPKKMRTLALRLMPMFVCIAISSGATHLRSGEIQVQQVSLDKLTVRITISVFINTINTNVLFGGEDDWLDFGDGTRMLIPETQNTLRPDLGEGVAIAEF